MVRAKEGDVNESFERIPCGESCSLFLVEKSLYSKSIESAAKEGIGVVHIPFRVVLTSMTVEPR